MNVETFPFELEGGSASPITPVLQNSPIDPRRMRSPRVGELDKGASLPQTLLHKYLSEWAEMDADLEAGYLEPEMGEEGENRIRWLIFDFSLVTGLDATAVRSCFMMLKCLLRNAGISVVFAALAPHMRELLVSHGVLSEEDMVYDTLDDAVEYCEEILLQGGESIHASF